jgi:hypothetical protein
MEYISIRQILDDLLADDMLKGLSLERAVNYAVEFIKVVGMPPIFESKVATIPIKDYRGELPCDFYEIIQVRKPKGFAYLSAEGSFLEGGKQNLSTYHIKGRIIFTSTKDDDVEIAYRAIKVDDDGFPLIPDNGTFARALELYIQKRYFTIQFNNSKIPLNVLQNTQQEYAFYVGQAQSDLIRPNIDQMESIKNMWNTLIPKIHKHADSFKTVNSPEILSF